MQSNTRNSEGRPLFPPARRYFEAHILPTRAVAKATVWLYPALYRTVLLKDRLMPVINGPYARCTDVRNPVTCTCPIGCSLCAIQSHAHLTDFAQY